MRMQQKHKNLLLCVLTAAAAMVVESKTGTVAKVMSLIKR